jgi:AraC family transcriptional regulator of adaptative response/methylated-DNA-[protein]-cysteine methyltransferase
MEKEKSINYQRIEKAIEYIRLNYKNQPSLNEIAEAVHLSPFHFQRLFSEWAGVSPKKFMQFISIQHAKQILKHQNDSIFNTAQEIGLSGSSRLHDLFINLEGMTPGEYKNGGLNLKINYSFAQTPFGDIFIGSTQKGICWIEFFSDKEKALENLKKKFPKACYHHKFDDLQKSALNFFSNNWQETDKIKLHLQGTDFQLKVWEALLKIPAGKLTTYGNVAEKINKPKASRAVGTAIGNNPVAFLIPCHRVIQSSGKLGGYMWGETRKTAIIGWEASKELE